MSHHQERKEKNCLNCNAEVAGRFCQVCGQENIEPKESFWVLATHFINDITHFDGKFFSTLKYLLFKPAFLSKEYLKGRRTSYLHPIRMYVFTSFVFFLIFYNFYQKEDALKINEGRKPVASDIKKLKDKKEELEKEIKTDTIALGMSVEKAKYKIDKINRGILILQKDSTKRDSIISANSDFVFLGENMQDSIKATSIKQYDEIQRGLPPSKRDGFIWQRIMHQKLHLEEKFKNDTDAIWRALLERFLHMFPQLLFVSLPFFALILQLLYVRRKQFFYVNHVVFTIHLYCGTFILILATLLLGSLLKIFNIGIAFYSVIAYLIILFYWYKSFRNFYSQSGRKTIFKFFILFFLTMIMMTFLFLLFFLLSAYLI
ncbi:MAG: DUF3667 domain-containing protein [Bacteroidetes bacterium]|nr:DUF3667 domain-containing protein [Bacteroidota bacterium]